MRALIGLVVGAWIVLSAVPAFACGEWHMFDKERALDVRYLINAALIKKGDKNYASLYFDIDRNAPMRVVRDKQVIFDIKNGKLLKLGKVVGTIDHGTLTIGKKTFTIELSDMKDLHGMPGWGKLEVRRGDDQIIEGEDVYPMCMEGAKPVDEITRRVVYYLAWRELGL